MEHSWETAASLASLGGESEEEEEAFRPPVSAAAGGDAGLDAPVLLVDLAAVAASAGGAVTDMQQARTKVLEALGGEGEFLARSENLFASGHCRHAERRSCGAEREAMEAERGGGAVVSVIFYPPICGGVPLRELWRAVREPSQWEVVDELKLRAARCHKSLKWKLEVAREAEALAGASVREGGGRPVNGNGGGGGGRSDGSAFGLDLANGCGAARLPGGSCEEEEVSALDLLLGLIFQGISLAELAEATQLAEPRRR